MNKSKWKKASLHMLALKLAEETGEVAKEITRYDGDGIFRSWNVLTELDHVIFIATTMRKRLKNDLKNEDGTI